MKISGRRAALALYDALKQVGLPRTSTLNGGEITGWLALHVSGSTGFSLKPREDGGLDWHLVISGKPHMRYVEERFHEDTTSRPVNPEVVVPRIRQAFAALGISLRSAELTDWSGWDDDCGFSCVTDRPEWLGAYDPTNRNDGRPRKPVLVVARVGFSGKFRGAGNLPAYQLEDGSIAVPREALEHLGRHLEWNGTSKQSVVFDGNGFVVIERDNGGLVPDRYAAARRVIENHWSDHLAVWTLPKAEVELLPSATELAVPTLVDGNWVSKLEFRTLDAQFGGEAPWLVVDDRPTPGM